MADSQPPLLQIARMHERHYGLTPSVSAALYEALRVALDRHHTSPVEFHILEKDLATRLEWEPTDARARRAHANSPEATAAAAYACIIAAVELTDDLVAISRSPHGTGADYFVAPSGTSPDDAEEFLRLEVSGTDRGGPGVIRARLADKVKQIRMGIGEEDGIAGVAGFQERLIRLEWVSVQ